MCKISVIIPIYNLEKYLSECLESVLSQSFKDFEVIGVNDGSTDKSGEILDCYALKDKRIKPIHIKNGGVSNARNVGLDNAHGKYICFLDGDDALTQNALEILYNNIQDFDMVQAAYKNIYADKTTISAKFNKALSGLDMILGSYFLGEIQESSCNKLYPRKLIRDLRFNTSLKVAEDSVFVHEFIKKAKKVRLINEVTYLYNRRENSCMMSALKEEHFYPLTLRDDCLKECNGNKALYKKWISFNTYISSDLIRFILANQTREFDCRLKELRKRIVTKKRYILFSPYFSLRFKIGVLVLWICPKAFYKLCSK